MSVEDSKPTDEEPATQKQYKTMSEEDSKPTDEEPATKKVKTGFEDHTLNISEAIMKGDEKDSFQDLLGLSVSTMQGIGPKATEVAEHLGLKTVQDLAEYKYFLWARAIKTLSETETEGGRLEGSMMNVDKMVDKAYETKTLHQLVTAPVAALQGVSEAAGSLLEELGVNTVEDLASFKYCRWAEAIAVASQHENEGTEADRKVERMEKKLEIVE